MWPKFVSKGLVANKTPTECKEKSWNEKIGQEPWMLNVAGSVEQIEWFW